MTICSFIGSHDVYDKDIYSRVHTAVNNIIEENDKVDFLFYCINPFISICLRAVLETRSSYPQKVSITLVLNESDYEGFKSQNSDNPPYCMVDKVILLSAPDSKEEDPIRFNKKVQRWIIRNSTHLVCYLYRQIYTEKNQLLDYAKRKSVSIIDLTDKSTEQAICKDIELLPEREQGFMVLWNCKSFTNICG